ncbi:histidine-containing phosphotransfer protein 1-like [Tasmannia lanceolata]|uniref:histidine-containing phosphotransfer protein 1-like n=1 Tax=Tasmannia lanceolata TaxID=3420 RepID=UPI004062E175
MKVFQLQRQLIDLTSSLFIEGFLDDQFTQLQQLQDERNPDFLFEVVSVFFDYTEKILNDVGSALELQTVNFKQVDGYVFEMNGTSSSIGVLRFKNASVAFGNFCEENDREGCLSCLQELKHEYSLVKSKFDSLFSLEQQILAAGGAMPMLK